MVGDIDDPRRTEPDFSLGDRDMLEGWLEFHRTTLLLKCEGLDAEQLRRRPVGTSRLSLHGLVRHMAEVERHWFARRLGARPDEPEVFPGSHAVDDGEFIDLESADYAADLATWEAECASSRRRAAGLVLDHGVALPDGRPLTLRWVYVHMIEEYARHNGHADLIREMIDGAVGG